MAILMSDLAAKLALRRQGISGPKAGGTKRITVIFFILTSHAPHFVGESRDP